MQHGWSLWAFVPDWIIPAPEPQPEEDEPPP
jgi:hypothetical protein